LRRRGSEKNRKKRSQGHAGKIPKKKKKLDYGVRLVSGDNFRNQRTAKRN